MCPFLPAMHPASHIAASMWRSKLPAIRPHFSSLSISIASTTADVDVDKDHVMVNIIKQYEINNLEGVNNPLVCCGHPSPMVDDVLAAIFDSGRVICQQLKWP